jgi:uroporphyrinogen-III synthase
VESHLDLLHRISGIASSSLNLSKIRGELIALVTEVTNCDDCFVHLLEESEGDQGLTGWVAQHQSVIALSSRAYFDPRFMSFPSLPRDTYEAFLSVPLIANGTAIGVINVHHKQPHRHSCQEVALLAYVAEQLAGAIVKARLIEENARLAAEALGLKQLLEARKVIERAKGILQQRNALTELQAYTHLRNQSRRLRRPMKDLAQAVIISEELHH